jgi:anti-anti-sigma factor
MLDGLARAFDCDASAGFTSWIRGTRRYACVMVSQAGKTGRKADFADLEVELIRIGHRMVIAVSGRIDIATADTLRQAIDGALEWGAAEVWIDLSKVEFMDSSGMQVLLAARGELRRRSARLALICPAGPGPVRRVLEIAGVASAFAVYPDRATAHAAG